MGIIGPSVELPSAPPTLHHTLNCSRTACLKSWGLHVLSRLWDVPVFHPLSHSLRATRSYQLFRSHPGYHFLWKSLLTSKAQVRGIFDEPLHTVRHPVPVLELPDSLFLPACIPHHSLFVLTPAVLIACNSVLSLEKMPVECRMNNACINKKNKILK